MRITILLVICSLVRTGQVQAAEPAAPREYTIYRVECPLTIDGKLDEPAWLAAPTVGTFSFAWHKEGKKEQTVVKMLWDDENLYVGHVCEDAHITARVQEHDGPVPQDDCFEIMFMPNPDKRDFYFNIEWNVIGGYVDGHRPKGAKSPSVPWVADGLRIAGSHAGTLNKDDDVDHYWVGEVAIPLANFAHELPYLPLEDGYTTYLNFNRHGGDTNMQYSQWSPSDTPQPAFHAPHCFGQVRFSSKISPFGLPRLSQ